jgi:hypothetical protein
MGPLARGRQDAQCAPGEQQEDGWRGGQAEGQGEEGGGAWSGRHSWLNVSVCCIQPTSKSIK